MKAWSHAHLAAMLVLAATSLGGSCDPVQSSKVDALGGESPTVRRGPLHRAGQPCLLCHDGAIGDPSEFSIAGTVFTEPAPAKPLGAANALVTMTNVGDGSSFTATTNAAGNFYVLPRQWTPVYPITVTVSGGGTTTCMTSLIGREGSCAGCHAEPVGPSSPGRVTLTSNLLPNGGCPK